MGFDQECKLVTFRYKHIRQYDLMVIHNMYDMTMTLATLERLSHVVFLMSTPIKFPLETH